MLSQAQNGGWTDPNRTLSNHTPPSNSLDEEQLSHFADELIDFPRRLGSPPFGLRTLIKQRLVGAEVAYRRGQGSGVSEPELSALLNEFASRMRLPEYAKTIPAQVRRLRMSLAIASPKFMGEGITSSSVADGSINAMMSPFQAYHLLNTLIDQKLMNEDYQLTPEEWETVHRRDSKAKSAARSAPGKTKAKLVSPSNERGAELLPVLKENASSLPLDEAASLVMAAFDRLRL